MNLRLAMTTIAVVIVAGGALYLLRPSSGQVGGPSALPSVAKPSTEPSAAASPVSGLDTTGWKPFSSARYGYRDAVPPTWETVPAKKFWAIPEGPSTTQEDLDLHVDPFEGYRFAASSASLPAGSTFEAWAADYRQRQVDPSAPAACDQTKQALVPLTIDGSPAILRVGCEEIEALLLDGGRIYSFGGSPSFGNSVFGVPEAFRAMFDAWLTTIKLDPSSAVEPSPAVLAKTGDIFQGTYIPQFDPPLTFSVDQELLTPNCYPGYQCRGNIDANAPGWLYLEFGQPAIEIGIVRVDKVNGTELPGRLIDPPADLAAWIASRPGLTVIAQKAVTVGGLAGTQLDVQTGNKDVHLGPIPGVTDPPNGLAKNSVIRLFVVPVDGHQVLISLLRPDGSLDELQPFVDSIVWN